MWFRKRNRRQAARAPAREAQLSAVLAPANRKRLLIGLSAMTLAVALVWSVLALLDRPVRRVEVTGQFLRVSALQIEQAVLFNALVNEWLDRVEENIINTTSTH